VLGGEPKSWILELELGAEGRSCSLELETEVRAEVVPWSWKLEPDKV